MGQRHLAVLISVKRLSNKWREGVSDILRKLVAGQGQHYTGEWILSWRKGWERGGKGVQAISIVHVLVLTNRIEGWGWSLLLSNNVWKKDLAAAEITLCASHLQRPRSQLWSFCRWHGPPFGNFVARGDLGCNEVHLKDTNILWSVWEG